jgi:hypothetical protein
MCIYVTNLFYTMNYIYIIATPLNNLMKLLMKEGGAVMLRNYIYRDHTIVITKASKTAVTGGIGAIPEEIASQAKRLLDGPPPAPYLKIKDALKVEPATLVSQVQNNTGK